MSFDMLGLGLFLGVVSSHRIFQCCWTPLCGERGVSVAVNFTFLHLIHFIFSTVFARSINTYLGEFYDVSANLSLWEGFRFLG